MLLTALLVIAAAGSEPVKVASPGFRVVDISPERGAFYSDHFANQMIAAGISITSEREISAMLGLERQKQLLGCSEGNECMVELANALGVQGILLGDVAKVGSRFQISLKIIDPSSGKPLSLKSMRVNDEEAVVDGLSALAVEMARELQKRFGKEPVAPVAIAPTGIRKTTWWIPALGGALVAGAGAVCLGISLSDYELLDPEKPGTLDPMTANAALSRGKTLQTVAGVLFAVGAAAAVGAVGIAAFGSETRVIAVATPEGGALSIAGSFP